MTVTQRLSVACLLACCSLLEACQLHLLRLVSSTWRLLSSLQTSCASWHEAVYRYFFDVTRTCVLELLDDGISLRFGGLRPFRFSFCKTYNSSCSRKVASSKHVQGGCTSHPMALWHVQKHPGSKTREPSLLTRTPATHDSLSSELTACGSSCSREVPPLQACPAPMLQGRKPASPGPITAA